MHACTSWVICCLSHCLNTLMIPADIRSSPGAEVLAAAPRRDPTSWVLTLSKASPPCAGLKTPSGPGGKCTCRIACSRSWQPSAMKPSSLTSTWPVLLIRGVVYAATVHTLFPSASCRNRFQQSLFAFLIACRNSCLATLTYDIRATPHFLLARSRSFLSFLRSSHHHGFDREHQRFFLACSSSVTVIAPLSDPATSVTSSFVLLSDRMGVLPNPAR